MIDLSSILSLQWRALVLPFPWFLRLLRPQRQQSRITPPSCHLGPLWSLRLAPMRLFRLHLLLHPHLLRRLHPRQSLFWSPPILPRFQTCAEAGEVSRRWRAHLCLVSSCAKTAARSSAAALPVNAAAAAAACGISCESAAMSASPWPRRHTFQHHCKKAWVVLLGGNDCRRCM